MYFSDFDNKQKQREKMRQEVETLLASDATSLEDVFALQSQEKQDEIMNQFTGANKSVMNFFSKKQRLFELIDYLIILPDPDKDSKDRCHKYPFLAHQLFTDGGDGVSYLVDRFFYSYDTEKHPSNSLVPSPQKSPIKFDGISPIKSPKSVGILKNQPKNSPKSSKFQLIQPDGSRSMFAQTKNVLSPPLLHEDDMDLMATDIQQQSPSANEPSETSSSGSNYKSLGQASADSSPQPIEPLTSDGNSQRSKSDGLKGFGERIDDQEILKNIENVVGLLNVAEDRAKRAKETRQEADNDDFERDQQADIDIDFGFEDAIDKPIEDIQAASKVDDDVDCDRQFNFDDIIKKIENPSNVKKSFELRCRNDDDDEIFIVHDAEEEQEQPAGKDQDHLFCQTPTLTFNIIDQKQQQAPQDTSNDTKKEAKDSPSGGFEKIDFDFKDFIDAQDGSENATGSSFNPFVDTLANSEALPVTQKLVSVEIQDNYLNQIAKKEESMLTQKLERTEQKAQDKQGSLLSQSARAIIGDEQQSPSSFLSASESSRLSSTVHQQKLQKRKQKKGGNLSIHKFDEATQRSIEHAVRQNLTQPLTDQIVQSQDNLKTEQSKAVSESRQLHQQVTSQVSNPKSQIAFSIVEDHIKDSLENTGADKNTSPSKENLDENTKVTNEFREDPVMVSDGNDELNDRIEQESKEPEAQQDGHLGQDTQHGADDEEDNILRQKQPVKLNIDIQGQDQKNSQTSFAIDLNKQSLNNELSNQKEDGDYSPTSPESPMDTITSPKFQDQESIELVEKIEKHLDYILIDRFFGFLAQREGLEPLNATLSGYFCKVTLIIISHQPRELLNYMQQNNYKLIDKMLQYIDDKSICELISKLLDEILKQLINIQDGNPTMSQENLANSIANLNEANGDQKLLQQSGQSGEKVDRDVIIDQMLTRSKTIIYTILQEKLGEESDPLERLGAIEILLDLLKNKVCYQILTTKHSFQIMTQILVSDCEDSKKNIYLLLKHLIQNYEKYERFEKRINIDNFDDEELMNSHSGSGSGILNRSKKSKGSRRQNQDVLKDIQESDLFQFIRVVVQEITSAEIETRYDKIQEAKCQQIRLPLGMFLISVIEFIEKASSVFSGFKNDMNKTLVDKDIFNYIFEILEYYHNSDIFNKTVSKIIINLLRSKSEDTPEMLKYLLEETKFVNFLVKNGPKCIQTEMKQINNFENLSFSSKMLKNYQSGPGGTSSDIAKTNISPKKEKDDEQSEEKTDKKSQKSPEQSSQIIEASKPAKSTSESLKKLKVQVPAKNGIALSAHVKEVCEVILEMSQSNVITEKTASLVKSANEGANQSQSGEQSKSSEIVIEDDEQHLEQTISKIVTINLNENSEWLSFISNQIQPISRLLKGKLCEEQNNSTSGFMNSDNNIFDDDFMRSNLEDDKIGADQLQKLSNDFDNVMSTDANRCSSGSIDTDSKQPIDQKDVVDHRKFFKKMQQCLSSNLNKLGAVGNNTNIIDTHEREMKQQAFSNGISPSLTENLKASLTDPNSLSNLEDLSRDPQQNFMLSGGRERSTSNEFCLPPLQDFNDHRDQANQNDQNLNNLLNAYKSNEKGQKMQMDPDLSAIAQVDDEFGPSAVDYEAGMGIDQHHGQPEITKYNANQLVSSTHSNQMQLDINLDDDSEDEAQNQERGNSNLGAINEYDEGLRNFNDFANSLDQAIGDGKNTGTNNNHAKKGNLTLDVTEQYQNSNAFFKNQKGFGDIFDKIDEFDNVFGTISPTLKAAPSDPFADTNNDASDLQLQSRSSSGMEIPMGRNSFGINKSEIVVQINKKSIGIAKNDEINEEDEDDCDPFASSPHSDKLPDDQEIEGFFSERVQNLNNLDKAQFKNQPEDQLAANSYYEKSDQQKPDNDLSGNISKPEGFFKDEDDNLDFNERLDQCQEIIEPLVPRRNSLRKDTNDLVERTSLSRKNGANPNEDGDNLDLIMASSTSRNLSKSVYVTHKQKILDELDDYRQEFGDNQFWKIDNNDQQNADVDDLLKELQQ